jgi:L-alanine-DL-glutamate epimerase-like enolase superfamily enzyme
VTKAEAALDAIASVGRVSGAEGLRVAEVEPVLLSHRYAEEQSWSGGRLPGFTAGLVRVRSEDGLTGVGETYMGNFAPEVVLALVRYYSPFLVGRDASDIAGAWELCTARTRYWGRTGVSISVLSGIEAALWDLCGKAVGKPVVELLGGPAHDELSGYASGGMAGSLDELGAELAGYVERGFRAAKIRIGVSPEADDAKTEAARAALGPGLALAADAVQGSNPRPWSADEAIACGRRLERHDLAWFEEPCAATDIAGYAACRRALDIPIAGAESTTTVAELSRFLEADALDLAQPDASHIGGVLEARRAGALAEAHGVEVAMHAWGGGPCVMANVHAGFATPACRWLELPTNPNPLIEALLVEPLELDDGRLRAPRAPGLGVELTPELEERYPYQPGCHYHFQERREGD